MATAIFVGLMAIADGIKEIPDFNMIGFLIFVFVFAIYDFISLIKK